ncbi:MAG TPA: DUF1684 domain-containing protein [Gaiellaceae bacterium]
MNTTDSQRLGSSVPTELVLLDWKRRIFDLYARIRAHGEPRHAWDEWRAARDELFRSHDQSPLSPEARPGFAGAAYFDYDPEARVLARLEGASPEPLEIATSQGTTYRFTRFALARFEYGGAEEALQVYWLDGYGGGVFLPFGDATNGSATYGGGRYLLDTVKGADLGMLGDELVLDFNFAYNPSCAYDPNWVCPLAPPENRLARPIEAGERVLQNA